MTTLDGSKFAFFAACLWAAIVSGPAHTAPPSPAPQDQAGLKPMLEMTWSAGTHLPQGMQDNHVALLDGWLVNALGFCCLH